MPKREVPEGARKAEIAIVLPVFNDAEWVASALDSCLAQTLRQIEIIVVDDASTDETVSIVKRYQATDERIQLIQQPTNRSAFQARRLGIEAAAAPFVLFLDGDDELVPEAAAEALALARAESADVVAFGCQVVKPDGSRGGDYEAAMQPQHRELVGANIAHALFPVGKTAQGQLWRYLFERSLLEAAYASVPSTLILPRANDLPIAFLALMRARRYVSTPAVLYRYFFRRGASGHRVTTLEDYQFIAGAIDSIDAIAGAVHAEAKNRQDGQSLLAAYASARLSVTGRVLDYAWGIVDEELRSECLTLLAERVGRLALLAACADFCSKALPLLAEAASPPALPGRDPRHILIRATNLGTGGAQGVVVAQAGYLAKPGRMVTIAVDATPDTHFRLPEGVQVIQIPGDSRAQKITSFAELCRDQRVDVVIDHWVFYNDRWPFFALAAAEAGIPTIGWIHNFALRPIVDGTTRMSFLERYLPLLATVVVLSEADVAYWKLRGVAHVVYLPNPPSPLLEHLPARTSAHHAPVDTLEIVWWGRLQQGTKQVRELVEIGSALRDLDIDFRLKIIGPDGPDLTREQLHDLARARGIDDALVTQGSLHGDDLVAAIEHAHVFVSTSIIEGYPLALVEAQALGLPLVMYELPWLATLQGNAGLIAVEQGDRRAAARALATLATDPALYEALSTGALAATRVALAHNFEALYTDLVCGRLAPVHSPAPSAADVRLLLHQNVLFVERLIRREKRAIERARADALGQRKRAERLRKEAGKPHARPLNTSVPSVARTGVKGWLQRFLPATMAQTGFFARHHHKVATLQHNQLIANQAALSDHLFRIEKSIGASSNSTREITGALESLTAFESEIAALGQRIQLLEEKLVDRHEATNHCIHLMDEKLTEVEAAVGQSIRPTGDRLASLDTAVTYLTDLVREGATTSSESLQLQGRSSRAADRVGRAANEAIWSAVFHDTVIDSAWFIDRALSPGRWAVGYPFLYVLYRILDELEPRSVLELGLGQSTKLVAQYAKHAPGVHHVVVEHDAGWIETFAKNYALPAETHVTRLDLGEVASSSHGTVRRYDGFAAAVGDHSYDLIIIDGPFGHSQDIARIDVLDILPHSLAPRFVIMLDDAHRPGEQAAAKLIVETLEQANVAHRTAVYRGQKDVWIAVSSDLEFLTTL